MKNIRECNQSSPWEASIQWSEWQRLSKWLSFYGNLLLFCSNSVFGHETKEDYVICVPSNEHNFSYIALRVSWKTSPLSPWWGALCSGLSVYHVAKSGFTLKENIYFYYQGYLRDSIWISAIVDETVTYLIIPC